MNAPAIFARRTLLPLYRTGVRCPACDGAHWDVGRGLAECVRCGCALPRAPEREMPTP